MTQRILIMGLPGSGKTTFAKRLCDFIDERGKTYTWLNADLVRATFNDWDFSEEGRIRQARRMRELANNATTDYVVCDFVAPLMHMRIIFDAHWTVWMDTIDAGRYEDTNKMFQSPLEGDYDFHFNRWDDGLTAEHVAQVVTGEVEPYVFDWRKETVQMLGRWQPWHAGHRALFERAIQKTGQVVIQIRDCQGWNDSNPFAIEQVKRYINRDLEHEYKGRYHIQIVPNIVNITYGRDVGYKIEQEVFDDTIHSISATKIRKDMGIE